MSTPQHLVDMEVYHCVTETIHHLWKSNSEFEEELETVMGKWVEGEDGEEEMLEALEYWAVSPYLYNCLEAKGELVAEILDFKVWGRTTSGQGIDMDSVIEDIAKELE